MKRFIDDDAGYLGWLSKNPAGFVVNCNRHPSPAYLILHHVTCGHIRTKKRTNWTTTEYIKICSLDKGELETWAQEEVGGSLQPCKVCHP